MDLEIRILDSRLAGWGFPARGSAGSAGIDLHACLPEPIRIAPGEPARLIPAGFAVAIGDPGWCGIVAPRSGLGHRGLVLGNTIGVIDADYRGEIIVSAWNRNAAGSDPIVVAPGDRIAQLLLVPVGRPVFLLVERFSTESARGGGGFGSTGTEARSRIDTPVQKG